MAGEEVQDNHRSDDPFGMSSTPVNGAAKESLSNVTDEIRAEVRATAVDVATAGDGEIARAFAELIAEEERYLAADFVARVEAGGEVRIAWLNWARAHLVHLRTLRLLATERKLLLAH